VASKGRGHLALNFRRETGPQWGGEHPSPCGVSMGQPFLKKRSWMISSERRPIITSGRKGSNA